MGAGYKSTRGHFTLRGKFSMSVIVKQLRAPSCIRKVQDEALDQARARAGQISDLGIAISILC